MQIDYDKLVLPDHIKVFAREVIKGQAQISVPASWQAIMIYHPATSQYYATKSATPFHYEQIVRERLQPRYDNLAIALRNMLEVHPQFQFFILSTKARGMVEKWMASIGKRRIATRMGEAATEEHVLREVYSPFNKVKRYVGAPASHSHRQVIGAANTSMAQWLASSASQHKHERETMRVALRSRFDPNRGVFEREATVTATTGFEGCKHNEFRSILMEKNLQAIREFIQSTVTGQ